MGQRLDWAVKGVRMVVIAMRAQPDSSEQRRRIDVCKRISHRASAYLRGARRVKPKEDEAEFHDVSIKLLAALDRARLWRHGRPPLLVRIWAGASEEQLNDMVNLAQLGADAVERLAMLRRRAAVRARRKFAAGADLRTAHRVTRLPAGAGRKTASSDKRHLGEATEQAAADQGIAEWSPAWLGDANDHGEDLARTVDDLYALGRAEGDADEVLLEPLTDAELVQRVTAKFKGGTGVGQD